jgi:hypothetical protein
VTNRRVAFLAAVDGQAVDEVFTRQRNRASLERVFSPELMHAFEEYVDERVAKAVQDLRDELEFAGGKPWLTTAEAGRLLGCSAHAIRMRCKRKRLEHKHQGRRLYVSARSVQELG